jgi:hypothetical protein
MLCVARASRCDSLIINSWTLYCSFQAMPARRLGPDSLSLESGVQTSGMAKHRCAAMVNKSSRALDIAMDKGGEAAALRLLRHHGPCRAWAVAGSPF